MDIFLNILWEQRLANPHKYQQFTFLANEEPKFIIECQPHLWSLPSAKLYENISNTTCCYCGKELSLTVSTSASVTFEKNFHKLAYCVNSQAISTYLTNKIKSAIQSIGHSLKKNRTKKKGSPLDSILSYLYANSEVGKNKSSKMKVYSALKKMVVSKELIETSVNGNLYYQLSDK